MKFYIVKKIRKISSIILLIFSCIGLFLGAVDAKGGFFLFCGGVSILALLVDFSMIFFWRCHNCKRLLPHKVLFIDYCPYCGDLLDVE